MRRREFVAALVGAAIVRPRRAQAQRAAKSFLIVVVSPGVARADLSETGRASQWRVFFKELRALGYIEGENVRIERRSGEGRPERYGAIAKEVVAMGPDVIVTTGASIPQHLSALTSTIPIVAATSDPIGQHLAASLARPGGNITGVTFDAGLEIYTKYVDMLKAIRPALATIGFLAPRFSWDGEPGRAMQEAARLFKITIVGPPLERFDESDYRRVIASYVDGGVGGVIVGPSPENFARGRLIVDLINSTRFVAVYPYPELARSGGLIGYGVDTDDVLRTCALYVDRILKGAAPSEMPFIEPMKWPLVINLKTAKALGVTVPQTLLARADEVIE
jgi:putative tryptophan/tyrosine transport system substrate-binding protein